jgi:uncharacterized phosphosugar-binding protein
MLGKGKEYLNYVSNLLQRIIETQADNIEEAAEIIAGAVMNGNALFAFGTVHSALPISDAYCRAGGFPLLNQIWAPALNSVELDPPALATAMERLEGYGSLVFSHVPAKAGDVLIVVSVSGRNPVPVEMAMSAKEKGLKVIALTSMEYTLSVPSRHSSGKRMYEFADVVIDSLTVPGDAILELDGLPVKFCATSGSVDAAIMHTLMAETIERLTRKGYDPPVYIAGNLDGYEDYRRKLRERLESEKYRIFHSLF